MAKIKKRPERMCVACREMKDKRSLIRLTRTPEGEVRIDESGKMAGRGAYVCRDAACLKKAAKGRILEKALKTKIPPEIWQQLAQEEAANTPEATKQE
ncbi:MAG: YlxR family protein [Firmicutes bacterium]|nr:YlxR family protein [Bacillota bacterium]